MFENIKKSKRPAGRLSAEAKNENQTYYILFYFYLNIVISMMSLIRFLHFSIFVSFDYLVICTFQETNKNSKNKNNKIVGTSHLLHHNKFNIKFGNFSILDNIYEKLR